jgi:hypothetical protein
VKARGAFRLARGVLTGHARCGAYVATGVMVEEHELSTYEKVTSYVSATDMIVIVIAFVLPGMPMSLFWPFAALALYGGYKFAICAMFGYCLLDYCIGGPKACD